MEIPGSAIYEGVAVRWERDEARRRVMFTAEINGGEYALANVVYDRDVERYGAFLLEMCGPRLATALRMRMDARAQADKAKE